MTDGTKFIINERMHVKNLLNLEHMCVCAHYFVNEVNPTVAERICE